MSVLILFLIGLSMSTISLVVGSMTPIYLGLMQVFFPALTLGNIMGADKVSGISRNLGAIPSFWSHIDWKFIAQNIPAFLIGSAIGASFISEISSDWILPLLIFAFFIAEFAPSLSRFFKGKAFLLFEGLLGVYAGVIVASIKPILLAVFRLRISDDNKIMFLKIQIQTIMFFVSVGAAVAHYFHGTLILWVIIPLAIGNILGGFLGGTILKKTGKMSGRIQKNVMRASFCIGILTSAWVVFR